jgi:hypothetical protein
MPELQTQDLAELLAVAGTCRMTLPNDENFAHSSFVTFVLMILFNVPK